ncbi:ABC transporter permease [Paeniglutamicibacter antarcticus]|uniref:ABC transporter permease n=1 Tax=Paeniglutamicibacter antarcticus TaxID=494023 RepID=A0ABP9TLK7_9MICC
MSITEQRTAPAVPPTNDLAATATAPWMIVTLREVTVKIKDKSFIISTAITLALIIGSVVFAGIMGDKTTTASVSFTQGSTASELLASANELATSTEQKIVLEPSPVGTEEAGLQALRDKDTDLVITATDGGYTLTGLTEVDASVQKLISDAAQALALETHAKDLGVTAESLTAGSKITPVLIEGSQERNSMALAMGLVFSFLFYMSSLIFGMPIANSVVEEKQNRVVEILATAIPIRQLLSGKILGNLILAMGQLCLFVGIGLLALSVMPTQIPFLSVVIATSGWFLAFFLAGFLILAAIWAALGAMASRVEDLQQSTGPVITVLIAVLFIGIYAKGSFLVIASYVPVVSSVAMPIRLLSTDVSLWEPIASLVLAVGAAWAMVLLGERIYRRAIMQTGGALSLRKALKLED